MVFAQKLEVRAQAGSSICNSITALTNAKTRIEDLDGGSIADLAERRGRLRPGLSGNPRCHAIIHSSSSFVSSPTRVESVTGKS